MGKHELREILLRKYKSTVERQVDSLPDQWSGQQEEDQDDDDITGAWEEADKGDVEQQGVDEEAENVE